MTKEEIFRAYFSNPELANERQLTQEDLIFTNCYTENERWSRSNLRVCGFKFTLLSSMYGSFRGLCSDSFKPTPEDFCLEQLFETGKIEGWKLVGVNIRSGVSRSEGDNFISLTYLKDSVDTFNETKDDGRPLGKNCVDLTFNDYNFKFLLEQGMDYALLVEYHGDMENIWSTHTTVTEIIDGHKSRVFSGWFAPQDITLEYVWKEISYKAPAA